MKGFFSVAMICTLMLTSTAHSVELQGGEVPAADLALVEGVAGNYQGRLSYNAQGTLRLSLVEGNKFRADFVNASNVPVPMITTGLPRERADCEARPDLAKSLRIRQGRVLEAEFALVKAGACRYVRGKRLNLRFRYSRDGRLRDVLAKVLSYEHTVIVMGEVDGVDSHYLTGQFTRLVQE